MQCSDPFGWSSNCWGAVEGLGERPGLLTSQEHTLSVCNCVFEEEREQECACSNQLYKVTTATQGWNSFIFHLQNLRTT